MQLIYDTAIDLELGRISIKLLVYENVNLI